MVRPCPYCAEEIQAAAVVCRFCNREVKPLAATPSSAALPTTKQERSGIARLVRFVGWAFLGFFVIGFIGNLLPSPPEEPASTGSTTGNAPASPSRAATPKQWTPVATWSGSGIKQTETFVTTSREWRVRWLAGKEAFAGAGILQIMVHNGDGALVTLAANKQGTGRDVSYVRTSPGRYYLLINSGNVEWEVTVEEER